MRNLDKESRNNLNQTSSGNPVNGTYEDPKLWKNWYEEDGRGLALAYIGVNGYFFYQDYQGNIAYYCRFRKVIDLT